MVKLIALCFIASYLPALYSAPSASATALKATPASATLGQTITLTASVTPATATGFVTFYDGTLILGISSVSGGVASLATGLIPSGKNTITALYQGDASFGASASGAFTETVTALQGTGFSAVNYPASTFATDAAIADFNRDGKPDIAMVGANGQEVSILLGAGNGSFVAGPVYPGGPQSTAIRTGDFNGDGRADIALLCGLQLCILLGRGDGTFTSATPVTLATPSASGSFETPETLTIADLNHDGKADIAIGYSAGITSLPTVSVFLGNGDGTFGSLSGYPAGNHLVSIGTADFNADGVPDLFAGDLSGTVSVLVGKGDGTFVPSGAYIAGTITYDCVAADFNEDGKPDIAVVTNGSPVGLHVAILLGNGDGTFRNGTYVNIPGSYSALSLAVEDFNGDGHFDLALGSTINISSNGSVNILAGKGRYFQFLIVCAHGNHPEQNADRGLKRRRKSRCSYQQQEQQ